MNRVVLLIIYLAGGVGLYPWIDVFRPVGSQLDNLYSWVLLDSGVEVGLYQVASFTYASVFHLIWSAIFSESAKTWVSTVNKSDICYLLLRMVGFFILSILILGLVGVGIEKRPYSDFHMYFSLLVTCVLLGGWAWSVKDAFLAILNYRGRRFV